MASACVTTSSDRSLHLSGHKTLWANLRLELQHHTQLTKDSGLAPLGATLLAAQVQLSHSLEPGAQAMAQGQADPQTPTLTRHSC